MSPDSASGVTVSEYRSGKTAPRAGPTASAASAAVTRAAKTAVQLARQRRAASLRAERIETALPFIRSGPVAPPSGRLLYRPTPQAPRTCDMPADPSFTYKDAGVDIDAGDALVERIKAPVKRTLRPEVIGGLGGFGGLFRVPEGYREPVLVAGTDGVGTKLKLAIEHGAHDGVGIDLVAMCANDVVVQGAEPLFFRDYYATGKLTVAQAEAVIKGIVEGCGQAGAARSGGETAEMPGVYAEGDYDLAGFCVGIVEKESIIDGSHTRPGDTIIGLPSSGPHSNGYSLIRKLLQTTKSTPTTKLGSGLLYAALLAPTRIY